jgi:hypothetical protein
MELLIVIENLIIIAMPCCEVEACSCLLPACRRGSVSPEDFRLIAIGTATRVTVVSEKLR